jgi:hypothetical protein
MGGNKLLLLYLNLQTEHKCLMKDFFRTANQWPARTPRLNVTHPLYTQNHNSFAGVAGQGGFVDLLTNTFATNTAVTYGVDENGPYVYNNAGTSSGTITFPGINSSANFTHMGCIFKHMGGGNRGYILCINGNTGWFLNGSTVDFLITNGTVASFVGVPGHTYYCIQTDGPATSGLPRMVFAYDMTTGIVVSVQGVTVAGNIPNTPITLCAPSIGTTTHRVYAGFSGGSVGAPFNSPWYQIPPIFFSVPQVLSTLQNPWSLWYA